MEMRVGLFQVVGEGIVNGDIGFPRKHDLRIFRALGERVTRWELGPEVGLGLLLGL